MHYYMTHLAHSMWIASKFLDAHSQCPIDPDSRAVLNKLLKLIEQATGPQGFRTRDAEGSPM